MSVQQADGWSDNLDDQSDTDWRGDLHPDHAEDDWPVWLAGPEYWMALERGLPPDAS